MATQPVNIGNSANDGTGDPLRNAFSIINDNFESIDLSLADTVTLSVLDNYTTNTAFDSEISTINSDLAGKAPLVHTHTISEVVGLTGALAGKASVSLVNSSISSLSTSVSSINQGLTDLENRVPNFYSSTESSFDLASLNSAYSAAPIGSRVYFTELKIVTEKISASNWIKFDWGTIT